MSTPMRFALLGTGGIADDWLAPALAAVEDACLWSVLSREHERAAAFARRHGAGAPVVAFDDLDRLLSDPALDAVIVATPDRLHATQAIAAMRAGKHVLVEKPMATSVADAQAMSDTAAALGVRLGVAYHLRWHAGHRLARRRMIDGAIGEPLHAHVQWTYRTDNADNWRAHPELARWWSLAAMGTHCLDLARWFLMPTAGETTAIRGVTSSGHRDTAHDETAAASLQFASGATAQILASVLFRSPRRLEILGSEGSIVADNTLGPRGAGTITLNGQPLEFEVSDPYAGEIRDFVRAVREGRDPEVSTAEGLRNVELLNALA